MKFGKSTQMHGRVAALVAGAIWFVLFAGMFIGSKIVHKNPTARWLGLFGPLLFIVAADQICNSEWHSKKWTAVKHNPEFYVWLGCIALVFATVLTVAGMVSWSHLPWFD